MRDGFGLALIISAFAFGFRHGIDWDHIAAITDITSSQPSVRTGLRFATLYAAGHALSVFVIGVVVIALGEALPDSVDAAMGRVVGVTLLVLGVYVLYSLIRHRGDFRMRSRWMLMFAGGRSVFRWVRSKIGRREHEHPHAHHHGLEHHHAEPERAADGSVLVRTAHTHTHTHTDPFVDYGTGTSLAVGVLHGVGAETPTQVVIFLAARGAGGPAAGVATLAVFLVGLFAANSVLAVMSASGFLAATKRFRVYATVSVITAVASLVLGVLFVTGNDAALPAIFGG
jgi:ABC-type nickel/cobalt efflux system permease component RcnA